MTINIDNDHVTMTISDYAMLCARANNSDYTKTALMYANEIIFSPENVENMEEARSVVSHLSGFLLKEMTEAVES